MRKTIWTPLIIFVSALSLLIAAQVLANSMGSGSIGTHDIWLEAWSSCQYPVDCNAHDVLYGNVRVKQDGDLFPGDQTKYDIWLIEGVSFFVCDQHNYDFWLDGKEITTVLHADHTSSLSWTLDVPETGRWYVVCYSDAIFRKHLEVSINRVGVFTPAGLIVTVSAAAFLALAVTLAIRCSRLRLSDRIRRPEQLTERRPEAEVSGRFTITESMLV
jgi:hypothetical protein